MPCALSSLRSFRFRVPFRADEQDGKGDYLVRYLMVVVGDQKRIIEDNRHEDAADRGSAV